MGTGSARAASKMALPVALGAALTISGVSGGSAGRPVGLATATRIYIGAAGLEWLAAVRREREREREGERKDMDVA